MATNPAPGVLHNLRIKRVALVDKGANLDTKTGDGAHIMLYKRDMAKDAGPGLGAVHVASPMWKDGDTNEQYGCPCPDCDGADIDEYEKAALNAESRAKIPDSKFLAVWTDAQGKKHRKLPVHDAGHVTAAAGRIDSAQMPADVKAAAHRKLERMTSHKEKKVAKPTFKSVVAKIAAAFAETDDAKRAAILKEAEADAEAAPAPGTPAHENAEQHHLDALQNLHKEMSENLHKMGPGPHPADHPYHKMKALHANLGKMLKEAGCEVETDEPGGLARPTPEVEKRFRDFEKSNADLQKRLDAEIEKRLDGEMCEILKGFKATGFTMTGPDNDVTRFRKMRQDDPATYERMMMLFKAADAQLAQSGFFSNFGSGRGGGGGSAYAEAEAMAKALVDKMEKNADGSRMTIHQAIDKVFEENSSLYTRYVNEQQ